MVFLTNPLWLIKTRMQLQPLRAQATQPEAAQERYRGLWHAVRTIVKEEGPLGLYKGAKEAECGRLSSWHGFPPPDAKTRKEGGAVIEEAHPPV